MSLKYRNFRNSNELIFVRNNHRFSYGSREAILAFIEKIPLEEQFDKQIEIKGGLCMNKNL